MFPVDRAVKTCSDRPVDYAEVTCPTCFEAFSIALPELDELPSQLDYDCEICCRPMVINCWADGGAVVAEALAVDD